jgi:hypothetical protein
MGGHFVLVISAALTSRNKVTPLSVEFAYFSEAEFVNLKVLFRHMSGDIEKNKENLSKVNHPVFEPDISIIFLQ